MKKYQTILADPPWKYGKGWGWGAEKYYRQKRSGWDVWGNEVESDIKL